MKRWKKALAAFAVASVMCFSMAAVGCGGKDNKDDKEPPKTEQPGDDTNNNNPDDTQQPSDTTAKVTSVTVAVKNNAKAEVEKGKTLELVATVVGTNNPATTVTWSSADTNKATVSNAGVVTGVAAGKVKITATSTVDNTKKGELEIEVKDGY